MRETTAPSACGPPAPSTTTRAGLLTSCVEPAGAALVPVEEAPWDGGGGEGPTACTLLQSTWGRGRMGRMGVCWVHTIATMEVVDPPSHLKQSWQAGRIERARSLTAALLWTAVHFGCWLPATDDVHRALKGAAKP